MDKRKLGILLGIVAAVVLVLIVVLVLGPEGNRGGGDEDGPQTPGDQATQWLDAPNPAEDVEKYEQYRRLWPDIDRPKVDREEVKRQWQEFAAKYPNNVYIPAQFLPEPTEEETRERRELLDSIGDFEGAQAAAMSASKWDPPGAGKEGPQAPPKANVTPEQQRKYFDYKIRELESRIQIVEYSIERNEIDAADAARAKTEIEAWKKEIEEFKEVAAKVPAT